MGPKLFIGLLLSLPLVLSESLFDLWEEEICLNTARASGMSSLKLSSIKLCYDINGDGQLDD